jgi:hypothetical protein
MLSLVRLSVKRQLYGAVRSIEPPKVTALNAVALAGQAAHYRGRSPQVYCWKTARQVTESASKNLLDPSLHFPSITELVACSEITVEVTV